MYLGVTAQSYLTDLLTEHTLSTCGSTKTHMAVPATEVWHLMPSHWSTLLASAMNPTEQLPGAVHMNWQLPLEAELPLEAGRGMVNRVFPGGEVEQDQCHSDATISYPPFPDSSRLCASKIAYLLNYQMIPTFWSASLY